MPRATTIAKPITVAAPVIEVMHEAIATPVIVPVAPAITVQPNLLMRFSPWIDDTYSDNRKATANNNAALTVTKAV